MSQFCHEGQKEPVCIVKQQTLRLQTIDLSLALHCDYEPLALGCRYNLSIKFLPSPKFNKFQVNTVLYGK